MTRSRSSSLTAAIILLFTGCLATQTVLAQKKQAWDLVKDFKAVPDNRTDNYPAFAMAAKTISAAGGGKLNIPKGNYYIAAHKGQMDSKNVAVADILFTNCNNLTINGNNASIRVNGNFTRTEDDKAQGLGFYYARNNTVCPFKLANCKNVLIKDLTLYGEVDKMKKAPNVAEGENYGMLIWDEEPAQVSSKVTFQNITAHHFAADGFAIKCNGSDIILNKCNSYNNARQGLSIVKGRSITVMNSSFDSTGHTGGYGWHAPGAGIDVENEFGKDQLANVLIKNCNLRGNKGFQVVTTMASENVTIDSCFISDLTAGYSDALNGVGMYSLNSRLSNCILFASIQVDLSDQIYRGPAVQEINKNIIYSGDRGIVSADFARPVNVTDNIFVMLPKPKMTTYFPYIQNYNCKYNRNIVAVHADRVTTDPTNQVTALVQWVTELQDDFWLVNGYTVAPEKQKTFYYLPGVNNAKNIKDNFFGPNEITWKYDFYKTHVLTDKQVRAILDTELFTAYKQRSLNTRYLQQAARVRAYTAGIVKAEQGK
jgi:hypothetical protein